ncbi:MAG: diguanylate cyclase/phosphodiesterase (GGDEF & EAL domains) with PAS/PAC sensor(s), partial [uncultured Blastococcus sp.]
MTLLAEGTSSAAEAALPELLAAAFPFHLAVDGAGRVVAVGPSLLRAAPGLTIGNEVGDHLEVLAPIGLQLRPDALTGHERSLVLLNALDGRLTLRGQLTRSGELAVFLGSPWVTDPGQLEPLGLSLADFAVHDPVADFLMLLQAQTAALADAERLAARLIEAAAAQAQLAAAERQLAAELDAIPDLTLRLNSAAMLLEVRPARDGQLSVPALELLGTSATELFPSWASRLPRALHRALTSGVTQALAFEQQGDDRRVGHYEARLTPSGADEVLVLVRDVTERRELERRLTEQAFTDPLTGLANRALLIDRIGHAISAAGRDASDVQPPVLLLIDLDDFKTVNDTLGHPAGDRLLTEVADRLREHTRPGDTAARLGGDEFAVLLSAGGPPDLGGDLAQRLLEALGEPVDLDGRQVHPRVSIGVAAADAELDQDGLLRNADLAMYVAKNAGKHRWAAFHPDFHEQVLDQLALETDLRTALGHVSGTSGAADGGQLDVHYQPVVELSSGTTVGVEALLRWMHPTRGAVSPADFIPLAEDVGLIGELGSWVLHRACQQAAAWQRDRAGEALTVSVNLSIRQLEQPGLYEDVRSALTASGLPPESLILEVTETALLNYTDAVLQAMTQLRTLGVRMALDDFGTGYSSLSRLRNLPVDMLKIDRAFVAQVCDGGVDSAIARAIVELGRALQLSVV